MKKFILECLFLFILVVFLYFILVFVSKKEPQQENDFMAAIIDKHTRLTEIDSPRFIFVGGSNLAFGLNSKEIQNEFSIPVVNLSLHAGLGLKFMLKEVKDIMKPNDVIFISTEYFFDTDGSYELKKHTRKHFPEASKYFTTDTKKEISMHLKNTRENLKTLKKRKNDAVNKSNSETDHIPVYSRAAFNKYGDAIAHIDLGYQNYLTGRKKFVYTFWPGIKELNKFYKKASKENVSVFFFYPHFPESEFKKNKEAFYKFQSDLTNNLNFEIINEPQDFVMPDSLFFDSVYHLNKEGREVKTKRLIDCIRKNEKLQQIIKALTKSWSNALIKHNL